MRHAASQFVSLAALLVALLTPPVIAAGKPAGAPASAFTADDLVRLKRLSDPQVSPDGRQIAFVLRETDIEANRDDRK
jgi:hypothetical protein